MSKKQVSFTDAVVAAITLAADMLGKEPNEVTKVDLLSNGLISDYTLRMAGSLPAIKKASFPVEGKDLAGMHKIRKASGYISRLESRVGLTESNIQDMMEVLAKQPKINVKTYKKAKKHKINREINLVLSDLHIGSDIIATQTGHLDFGRKEEARRLAKITQEACDYKLQHRNETKLNVLLLGDIIQNQLHDQRDGAPAAEQCGRAIYLLTQAIAQLAVNYPSVAIYCNSGNHGRNTGRHHGRAVNQKWDSLETIIYFALREACKSLKNVTFHLPKTPFVVYEVFGKKIFATHGDSVLSVGYPGKAINTGKLETQVNRFNASLTDKDEYSVFVVGHVHTASVTHLSNGAVLLTNGAMVPVDEYAVSIGMMESTSGQYLFESTEGFPVGDCRYIRVTKEDDKNKELDKIIKSWED